MSINKRQLLQMAQQLKKNQGAQDESQALEKLAETGLSQQQQAQLQELVRDKDRLQQIISSPKAQALMKRLGMDGSDS
ncbi:MAG: hypothetical protein FWE40_02810 [Oscillospiraceae bacterium]|jgi:hypothetical protein|nr:hypothetical protein [Oscillospiraceae bacterium]